MFNGSISRLSTLMLWTWGDGWGNVPSGLEILVGGVGGG